MALRRLLGYSDGELMRSDSKPCSRLMRQTAGIFSVGGGLGFWILCRLHYGPRITVPRSLRWAACGAVSASSTTALLLLTTNENSGDHKGSRVPEMKNAWGEAYDQLVAAVKKEMKPSSQLSQE
ncbi:hypothetical protein RJ640_019086 [Escallonia rubra]|uniref:DUF7875 domain-containing protein n=1 Tax=Escallonia rubra TaxID=112253 RepID=A0AA88UBJ0_9ASTE|nr:hypothetical protein RJ640_019086 [Escallonia rubra]